MLSELNFTAVKILGVEFDALTITELCKVVSDSVECRERRVIASQNLHGIYLFHNDPVMRNFFSKVYKIHIDGMPLVYLARMFGYPVRCEHRITYLDIVWPLIEECTRQGWRVYYLGGERGVSAEAARRLRSSFPELQIETHHGFFQKSGEENDQVLEMIRSFKPNVLMVGMGMPLQERWISENLEQIDSNVILTTGACFDYIAGVVPSPPRWMGWIGLEWLFRLASEPGRLWKRYLLEPWFIVGLVFKEIFILNQGK